MQCKPVCDILKEMTILNIECVRAIIISLPVLDQLPAGCLGGGTNSDKLTYLILNILPLHTVKFNMKNRKYSNQWWTWTPIRVHHQFK